MDKLKRKLNLLPINIQLFAGEGKDAKWADANDGNADGYITVPGPNGASYNVPTNVFNKIGTNWDDKTDKVKEAKIFISYYLTYGETPDRKSSDFDTQLKAFADSIGIKLPGDNFAQELYDDAIPALVTALGAGSVLDTKSNQPVVKNPNGSNYISSRDPQATGFSQSYGNPVGKMDDGTLVYQTGGGRVVDYEGNTAIVFTDNSGKKYNLDSTSNTYRSSQGDLYTPVPDDVRLQNSPSPAEDAFNEYYRDVMSYGTPGTFGNAMLNNNASLYEKQAAGAAQISEASVQSQALAQAQSMQQVVNSLKAERNAQLRGGLSEAQLADRELNMLIGASQQLNQQNVMARQGVLEADLARNTAYETAFNDYVTQAAAFGQNAAANYASKSSDVLSQAKELNQLVASGVMTQEQVNNYIANLTGQKNNQQ